MRNMEEFCYPISEWEYDNKALKESMDKMPATFEMWTPFARKLESKEDLYPSKQKEIDDEDVGNDKWKTYISRS